MAYEPVMGMEVHVHLRTQTKMFCACRWQFGAPPNTQVCPVCLGLPGTLPMMNRQAFELGLRLALALQCRLQPRTVMDRKNYYYPDLPKNYQISQDSCHLGTDGVLEIPTAAGFKPIRIRNVHLEEDAGKLMHPDDLGTDFSVVDLNRAGVPLAEIVSEPDLADLEELEAYMHELRLVLLYAGVSDCRMEQGQLRYELSVSLRPAGTTALGARVEIKNLNSMRAVLNVAQYEIARQSRILQSGGTVERETRLYNERLNCTERMRSKEEAHDYRYFPEPDLLPIQIDADLCERLRRQLPELPGPMRRRFQSAYGLTAYDANELVQDRDRAGYFEQTVAAGADPKLAANWILNELSSQMNARGLSLQELRVRPPDLAALIRLVADGTISGNIARDQVLPEMLETGTSAAAIVQARGLQQVSDAGQLEALVDQVLRENPRSVADFQAGKAKAFGHLMGQVMRLARGRANPQVVQDLIRRKIAR